MLLVSVGNTNKYYSVSFAQYTFDFEVRIPQQQFD